MKLTAEQIAEKYKVACPLDGIPTEASIVWALIPDLLAHIAQLEAELAELREEERWIPVGERLPEKNDWILGYTSATRSTQASIEKSRGFMLSLRGCDITHWRPLPQPPEAKGE